MTWRLVPTRRYPRLTITIVVILVQTFTSWPKISWLPFLSEIRPAQAAITFQSAGTLKYSAASGTSVAPAYPASVTSGDLLILIIGMKPSTANSGSVTTPSGWSPITSLVGAGGYGTTLAADTGNTNIFAYFKVAAGTESGSLTVTIATNNVGWGQIYLYSNTSKSWDVAGTTGSDTSAGSVSIAMSANPGVTINDQIIGGMVIPTDVTTPAQFSAEALTQTGATFGTVTEVSEPDSTNGNDIGGFIFRSAVSAGTASAAPTLTATAGGTTTNVRGPGIFIRIREVFPTYTQSAYRVFNNANSADVGSAPAAQDTAVTLGTAGATFRVRLLLHVDTAQLVASGQAFTLQYVGRGSGSCASPSGGTPSAYTDVTTSTVIAYSDNASPADGANLTANGNDPGHSSHTIVNQTYEELNNFTNSTAAIPSGQDGKWDFSLKDNNAVAGATYCLRVVLSDGAALTTYSVYPEITTMQSSGSLTADIVDGSGVSVVSPTMVMTAGTVSFSFQTVTGSFGTSSQKMRINNTTGTPSWTLSLAASVTTAFWDSAGTDYDFNDPTANAADGGDADALGGRMTIDASGSTITPQAGCTSTGLSKGVSTGFSEGVTNSITLISAGASASTNCYWDITGISVSQTIPREQPAAADYDLDMILSVI